MISTACGAHWTWSSVNPFLSKRDAHGGLENGYRGGSLASVGTAAVTAAPNCVGGHQGDVVVQPFCPGRREKSRSAWASTIAGIRVSGEAADPVFWHGVRNLRYQVTKVAKNSKKTQSKWA